MLYHLYGLSVSLLLVIMFYHLYDLSVSMLMIHVFFLDYPYQCVNQCVYQVCDDTCVIAFVCYLTGWHILSVYHCIQRASGSCVSVPCDYTCFIIFMDYLYQCFIPACVMIHVLSPLCKCDDTCVIIFMRVL